MRCPASCRFTAQAEADAWQQAADAATRHDHVKSQTRRRSPPRWPPNAAASEAASDRYEEWSAATSGIRETAATAKAELERRGLPRNQPDSSSPDQKALR